MLRRLMAKNMPINAAERRRKLAGLAKNKRPGLAVHDNHGMKKRAKTAKSLRVGSF